MLLFLALIMIDNNDVNGPKHLPINLMNLSNKTSFFVSNVLLNALIFVHATYKCDVKLPKKNFSLENLSHSTCQLTYTD